MMADRFGYGYGQAHKPHMQKWYRRLWFKFYRRWMYEQPVRSTQEYNIRCKDNLNLDHLIVATPPPSIRDKLSHDFRKLWQACQTNFWRRHIKPNSESRMPVSPKSQMLEKQIPLEMIGPLDLRPPSVSETERELDRVRSNQSKRQPGRKIPSSPKRKFFM